MSSNSNIHFLDSLVVTYKFLKPFFNLTSTSSYIHFSSKCYLGKDSGRREYKAKKWREKTIDMTASTFLGELSSWTISLCCKAISTQAKHLLINEILGVSWCRCQWSNCKMYNHNLHLDSLKIDKNIPPFSIKISKIRKIIRTFINNKTIIIIAK